MASCSLVTRACVAKAMEKFACYHFFFFWVVNLVVSDSHNDIPCSCHWSGFRVAAVILHRLHPGWEFFFFCSSSFLQPDNDNDGLFFALEKQYIHSFSHLVSLATFDSLLHGTLDTHNSPGVSTICLSQTSLSFSLSHPQ
jgi:hypothetical protein